MLKLTYYECNLMVPVLHTHVFNFPLVLMISINIFSQILRYCIFFHVLLQVDNFGTVNLVEACRKLGVNRFILISSILVNGAAMGQILNPAYIFLNVFGLTLVAKLQAEQYIRKSGINYTIIRPGGLRNEPPVGNLVMEAEVIPLFMLDFLELFLHFL